MRTIDAPLDGAGLRVGIVAGRFNDFVSNSLVSGARARLLALGVADDDIDLAWVAGAFEVPLAARAMTESVPLGLQVPDVFRVGVRVQWDPASDL